MKAIEINKWMNKRSVLGEWRLHCLWLWANGMCEQPPSVQLKLFLPRWQNIPDECGCVCGWSKVKQERLIFKKKKYCQVLNIMVCIYSRWGCPAIRICISGERHLAIRYRISELNTFFFLRSFLAVPRATSADIAWAGCPGRAQHGRRSGSSLMKKRIRKSSNWCC